MNAARLGYTLRERDGYVALLSHLWGSQRASLANCAWSLETADSKRVVSWTIEYPLASYSVAILSHASVVRESIN